MCSDCEPASLASCCEGKSINISMLFRSGIDWYFSGCCFCHFIPILCYEQEGSVSDNKWLRANQLTVMNYSSTCYIIQPSNHLYLLHPNSNDVLAVTDFQSHTTYCLQKQIQFCWFINRYLCARYQVSLKI